MKTKLLLIFIFVAATVILWAEFVKIPNTKSDLSAADVDSETGVLPVSQEGGNAPLSPAQLAEIK
jgi:hypothetical protein